MSPQQGQRSRSRRLDGIGAVGGVPRPLLQKRRTIGEMTGLKLSLFGGLGIYDARTGTPFDLPTRKSRALLAYLALAPGATRSREQLAGTLWERSAEEQARASLRQTLSTLRKAFARAPAPVIQADGDLIFLEATAIEVDALHFERLAA